MWLLEVSDSAVSFVGDAAAETVGKFRSQKSVRSAMDICMAEIDRGLTSEGVSMLAAFIRSNDIVIGKFVGIAGHVNEERSI